MALLWSALDPFGIELDHDLAQPMSGEERQELRDLLFAHGLVVARGQALSMAAQRAVCEAIGPILLREGEGETMSNEPGGPAASALSWHSDAAYTEHPFDALSLHALDVVPDASSTLFVHAADALERLPGDLRTVLKGREQEMVSPHYTAVDRRTCDNPDPQAMKRGVRPAILSNPHDGRDCLWIGELQTARLLGMSWEESRAVLHAAFDAFYALDRVHEHRWRNGDFVLWDNIALQHARGSLAGCGRRVLQRAIVGTEGVAPHVAG